MEKLLLFALMAVVWVTAHAQQIDEELAMKALFQAKHAVNRAAHAAAQQLDEEQLAHGNVWIDSERASAAAKTYLMGNLQLDNSLKPIAGSFLHRPVEIVVFKVVNSDEMFPYTYRNMSYNYEVTLWHPGVILIIHLHYPRVFGALEPIDWYVKGAAELSG
ncbi:hypothetical protein PCCS19_52010 [Paenibacillus sp. CCS19]|uniref:hypothetical protein n=1 Tax=Paenibacillus sp. CCS19 TaxID=3158387 RepID=UPI00256D320C|nr:hypothetical protein [Paenibacillus cellulosilyticus]GMK42142.1 hypothetical protein PCCS19_52010 [Paenibacillus cellulosilyticus]